MKRNLVRLLLFALSLGCVCRNAEAEENKDEARFLSNARQLIFEGRRSGEGYFSPDGKALIFQSEREPDNPFYQIYALDLTSGDTERVSPGRGKTTCAFFRPDKDEVLFASTHHDPKAREKQKAELDFRASGKERRYSWDYDEAMDIFAARRDGSNLRRLTKANGYDAEGSYSPDGSKIVFCSLRAAYPLGKLSAEDRKRYETDPAYFGEIYLMDSDGSNQRRLTTAPGYDGGPFFSPDGQRIIWRRFDKSGAIADVYTMKLDGSDERRLTDFKAMSWAPYFHPSGHYVIFTSNKLGFSNFELYLVDAKGEHEPVRVTFTNGFDGLPVFSPDGKQLCWTTGRTADGKSQLFLTNWNHEAALAAIAQSPPAGQSPAPSASAAAQPTATPSPSRPEHRGTPEITAADLREEVGFLAAEERQGRMTGSPGARQAADYIATRLQDAKLNPAGDNNTFFQKFEFNAGVRVLKEKNELVLRADAKSEPVRFEVEKDFAPLSFTENQTVDAEVVFAGYGLSVPGQGAEGYDSYAGVDVKDKIALVLRYVPEEVEPKRRQELNRYAGLRYKAMLARERGAKAVLFVTGPNSPNKGELVPASFDASMANSGIVAVSISGNVADALFQRSGKDLKSLQAALDKENPHAESGFTLPNVTAHITAAVEHIRKDDRNVIAVLPPSGPPERAEYVVIGAHYDHLGFGETGAMQRKGEEGKVHPGADDNASGAAAVLELAAALAEEQKAKPKEFQRGIVFAFWSGEEIGIIGSSYFVEHPAITLSKVAAYVNFDMVGRLRENKLSLQGVGSSKAWPRLVEKRNVAAGFNLSLQEDPYLPTDITSFYPKGVPVLNFFTGGHDDYHRPTDTADKLDYDGLERITKFARALVADLAKGAERPDYVKVQQSAQPGGRETLRVFLGTIPDYATEVVGVKLAGIRGSSPAEKAGLKPGDIIVEFGSQKVSNIYDYTYALDAAKIGQAVDIVVMRDGERVKITVTPEARK
ncbi:MAG TPA: M20/M25/M40 family metallo-hydrolase [Chthoniobacterales bacterium]|nr:M20/M25/M40 family metallo-hydrolase [Chthoniobacterales bacterium]